MYRSFLSQVSSDIAEPDAILVRSHIMLDTEVPASVKAIGRAGAGTNNIPVQAMNVRGIPVFNTPGANANAVKELVIAACFWLRVIWFLLCSLWKRCKAMMRH